MATYKSIPQYPTSNYRINVSWSYLKDQLDHWNEDPKYPLILQPDYQRNYVWTNKQQIAYCEYILRGGTSGREIFFNCPSWMDGFNHSIECVDGQQRIGAVLAFLDNKIPVFGNYNKDYIDKLSHSGPSFMFNVCKVSDRAELLRWYISMNTGGSKHTKKDLAPAYDALNVIENSKK